MPDDEKPMTELSTEEVMWRLFPPAVVQQVYDLAHAKDKPRPSKRPPPSSQS